MLLPRAVPLLVLVALLSAPVAAWASSSQTTDNGTLEIIKGRGTVDLRAAGAVLAKIKKGKVKVKIFHRRRGEGQVIIRMRGEGTVTRRDGNVIYNGRNIRIRIVDQKFRVQITGVGIHLSAVATGQVILQADPNAVDPGSFSIDGDDYQALPELATTYQIGSAPSS